MDSEGSAETNQNSAQENDQQERQMDQRMAWAGRKCGFQTLNW